MKLRVLRKRQSRVTRAFRHIRSYGRRETARLLTGFVGSFDEVRLITSPLSTALSTARVVSY